jgi:trehalose 6-phosphate phosphatase
LSVTIDPRRHDAVLFDFDDAAVDTELVQRLQQAGVSATGVTNPPGLVEVCRQLAVRPGRCAVVADTEDAVAAARNGGFAVVIGVGETAPGADVVVAHLNEIAVRTGDRPMSALPNAMTALDPAAIGRPAVFFDFDGTLSDIVDDPGSARLTPAAADALQALAARCPVAVLSGRDLADVEERIGLLGIWYAGSHGFELTGPDGAHHQNDAAAAAVPVLADAAAELGTQLEPVPGVVVEHKRFAVAVHYRNAARENVGQLTAAVHAAGRRHTLRVTTGREIIELRPDINWDKGKTLRWIVGRLTDSGAGRLLPIYLGDDITDEDAFDAVCDPEVGGIGIVVRHSDDGDRATAAQFALDSPGQVSEFAARLARQLNEPR